MGSRLSYNVGACKIMPKVPTTQAVVKIQRNKRSKTKATYFQSSLIWKRDRERHQLILVYNKKTKNLFGFENDRIAPDRTKWHVSTLKKAKPLAGGDDCQAGASFSSRPMLSKLSLAISCCLTVSDFSMLFTFSLISFRSVLVISSINLTQHGPQNGFLFPPIHGANQWYTVSLPQRTRFTRVQRKVSLVPEAHGPKPGMNSQASNDPRNDIVHGVINW